MRIESSESPTATDLLELARSREKTPFDYIIVGAGAAGGPLAARLAEAGRTVLLIDAGIDPICDEEVDNHPPYTAERSEQTYSVPAFHGAATEDPRMSWGFSVRHYASQPAQAQDTKYQPAKDPARPGSTGPGGGIFYPRASGLGGCTTHYAMIVVRPNDSDWNRIAQRTQDTSWRAENMQGYFARIENCLYYDKFEGFFGTILFIYKWFKRLLTFINPKTQLARGGHGRGGWQVTSFIDPILVLKISKGDGTFRSVLFRTILFLLRQPGRFKRLAAFARTLRFVQLLDPNYGVARSALNGQLSFIPVGTDGTRRISVRERLADVEKKFPSRLVIKTQTFAKRVVFTDGDGRVPRAIGVEVAEGLRLYEAARDTTPPDATAHDAGIFYAREEVVLAGGAFNSPQLLMLSGIGDREALKAAKVEGVCDSEGKQVARDRYVHLPGVGRNLQDRYEVSVVSEAKDRDKQVEEFKTLQGVRFKPYDSTDPPGTKDSALEQWRKDGTGLYATNGGAVSFFYTSSKAVPVDGTPLIDPDLFIFGAPAAFRGYYWNWSKELLYRTQGAGVEQRNLWSWLILKAYTRNNAGSVKLRTNNPFHQPDICFASFPPSIPAAADDVEALCEGVDFVRRLNASVPLLEDNEVQPGATRADRDAMRRWVQDEAWGHHACGTCRIGEDAWNEDPAKLVDREAVIDSKFRVHGVRGLRVVDASVFPEIPGYFIVTPIFMVAEKAADELLNTRQRQQFPGQFEQAEAGAVRERRRIAGTLATDAPAINGKLPEDTVGLALSGGGIRSATLCLGVLQSLAQRGRLKGIDYLATVSGGGYIGSFLGRLFTRQSDKVRDPAQRVEQVVGNVNSAENRWLREHANYLSGAGRTDREVNLGVVWRNLLGAHISLAGMFIGLFAVFRWLTDNTWLDFAGTRLLGLDVSPWWWIPLAVFVFGIYPSWLAFFLAPKPGARAAHPLYALLTWLVMLGAAVAALRLHRPVVELLATIAITSLLVAWLWQEFARINAVKDVNDTRAVKHLGTVVRNRLTRGLGLMLTTIVWTTGWVILDSLARLGAQHRLMFPTVGGMAILATLMPLWRMGAAKLGGTTPAAAGLLRNLAAGAVAFPILGFLLFGYDVIAHTAFDAGPRIGVWTLLLALLVAFILSRAHGFLNLTSLGPHYASRLARTFLGASSEARVHANPGEAPPEVSAAHPDDDIFFDEYHPEKRGGPLHLLSTCVNETVDAMSGRAIDEDKGLQMCVGPKGVSVGRRFHALWTAKDSGMISQRIMRAMDDSAAPASLCPLPVAPDPNAFHVLSRDPLRADDICVCPEQLRLSQWMAISGAAFTPGQGRNTSLPMSLLLGLFNVRLGYWWDSGVGTGERPGRFPPSFLRRIGSIPSFLFKTQSTLLAEWWRYFQGPGHRFWYLSDGGHIENSALYELLRRRVRFMIMVDGTHDPEYIFDDLSALVRRARLDFGASFEWIDPAVAKNLPPQWIQDWIDTNALGTLGSLKREGPHAGALARVTYDGDEKNPCWLLVLKGCLVPQDMPLDLRCYSEQNKQFPNDSTFDQFLGDDQWESYRVLGERNANRIFKDG